MKTRYQVVEFKIDSRTMPPTNDSRIVKKDLNQTAAEKLADKMNEAAPIDDLHDVMLSYMVRPQRAA